MPMPAAPDRVEGAVVRVDALIGGLLVSPNLTFAIAHDARIGAGRVAAVIVRPTLLAVFTLPAIAALVGHLR